MKCDVHCRCACRAELKLEDYDIPAAITYARRWWKAHKDC